MVCPKCGKELNEGEICSCSSSEPIVLDANISTPINNMNNAPVETNNIQTNINVANNNTEGVQPSIEIVPDDNIEPPVKKKNSKPIVIILLILVILIIAGVLVYIKFFMNNKTTKEVYTTLANKVQSTLFTNIEAKSIYMEGNLLVSASQNGSVIIDGLNLDYKGGYDISNKILNMGLNVSYDSDKVVDTLIYYENKKAAILFKDILDKYIYSDIDNAIATKEYDPKDIKTVISNIIETFFNSISEDNYSKKSTKYNNKDVTDYILTLSQENDPSIVKTLESLSKNEEFLKAYKNLSNDYSTTEEVSEYLLSLIDNTGETSNLKTTINLYLDSKYNLIGLTLINDQEENDPITNLEIKNNNEIYSYVIVTDGSKVTGTYSLNNNTSKITMNIIDSDVEINLSMNNKEEINKTISKEDITDAYDVKVLTSDSYNYILTEIMKNPGSKKLQELITTISSMINTSEA